MIKEPLFYLPLNSLQDHTDKKYIPVFFTTGVDSLVVHDYRAEQMAVELDPDFGSYVSFSAPGTKKGQVPFVEVRMEEDFNLDKGFTVCCWLKPTSEPNSSSKNVVLCGARKNSRGKPLGNVFQIDATSIECLSADKWQHFAILYQSTGAYQFFVDGQPVESMQGFPTFSQHDTPNIIRIAKSFFNPNDNVGYTGGMAHLRWYDQPLSQAEIQRIIQRDQQLAQQATLPLEMKLYTIDEGDYLPVLFIERAGQENDVELQLTNPTAKEYTFAEDELENYHIQLAFRKKVISDNWQKDFSGQLAVGDKWELINIDRTGKEEDVLSLRSTETLILGPGASTIISLPKFAVAAMGGDRNTRVQIRAKLVEFNSPVTVMRHLEIQSHRGQRNIPLVARIQGSNSLLNTGADNTLTIRIANMNEQGAVKLRGASGETASKLTLRLPGDIVKDTTVAAAVTSDGASAKFDISNATTAPDGDSVIITLTMKAGEELAISRGKPLDITLTHWECKAGTLGNYLLELAYEDIPGYWPGRWQLPVEVSPLLFSSNSVRVAGDFDAGGKIYVGEDAMKTGALAAFKSDYGDVGQTDHALIFGGEHGNDGAKNYSWIRFHSRPANGAVTAAHNLEIQVHQQGTDHLVLNPHGGNVGVGTDEPQARFHVVGNLGIAAIFDGPHVGTDGISPGISIREVTSENISSEVSIRNNSGGIIFYGWHDDSAVRIGSLGQDDSSIESNLSIKGKLLTGKYPEIGKDIFTANPWFLAGKIDLHTLVVLKKSEFVETKLPTDYIVIKTYGYLNGNLIEKLQNSVFEDHFEWSRNDNSEYWKIVRSNPGGGLAENADYDIIYYAIHASLFADVSTLPTQTL